MTIDIKNSNLDGYAAPSAKLSPAAKPASEFAEAHKIWEEIKDLDLNMFSLPGQLVSFYFKEAFIEPKRLYLTLKANKATSTIAALEQLIDKKFEITQADKFTIVSRK